MTDLLARADRDLGWFDAFRIDAVGAEPHPARTRAAMPAAYSEGYAAYTLQQLLTRATVRFRGPSPAEVRLACQAAVARHLFVRQAAEHPELDVSIEGPEPATGKGTTPT